MDAKIWVRIVDYTNTDAWSEQDCIAGVKLWINCGIEYAPKKTVVTDIPLHIRQKLSMYSATHYRVVDDKKVLVPVMDYAYYGRFVLYDPLTKTVDWSASFRKREFEEED